MRQVFRVTRECISIDRVTGESRASDEVVYAITSLSRDQANAARLLNLNRNHWTIEINVFYVREETFGKDRSRIRTQSGPQVMAPLRNAALSLLRLSASQRSCSWISQRTRNLLGIVN